MTKPQASFKPTWKEIEPVVSRREQTQGSKAASLFLAYRAGVFLSGRMRATGMETANGWVPQELVSGLGIHCLSPEGKGPAVSTGGAQKRPPGTPKQHQVRPPTQSGLQTSCMDPECWHAGVLSWAESPSHRTQKPCPSCLSLTSVTE